MPNPPVGAAALDDTGKILGVAAHERAGEFHAERKLIEKLRSEGSLNQARTMVVTLEPCNHTGQTPPCTEAITSTSIKRVIYGASDPNPKASGGGEYLKKQSLEVLQLANISGDTDGSLALLSERCELQIRAFKNLITTGLPCVFMKTAHQADGSMIPPAGQKTFTSETSLKLAHVLRKESDAILTGVGTVLADQPEFTVRHVEDHRKIPRWIVVMDRNERTPKDWITSREKAGFKVKIFGELKEALKFLGDEGCLQVLVEAGPTLVKSFQKEQLWDEWVKIQVQPGKPDAIQRSLNKTLRQ